MDFSTDALRHSKVRLRWDEDDTERDKVTRRNLSKKEIDEGNFKALLASSSSESEGEGRVKPKARKGDRDKLRNLLLNADDDQLPEGWGDAFDAAGGSGEGDMEITFMPALSGAKANSDDETTLDKYKRKQKEKRTKKKEEKEGKSKGHAKEEKDDFFGDSDEGDVDVDADEDGDAHREATREELELVAAPDDASAQIKHFDMNAIVKAEKRKGKKGKKSRRKGDEDDQAEMQEDFQLDVADSRFKAVHEDPGFAIDPSNPQYVLSGFHWWSSSDNFPQFQENEGHVSHLQRAIETPTKQIHFQIRSTIRKGCWSAKSEPQEARRERQKKELSTRC